MALLHAAAAAQAGPDARHRISPARRFALGSGRELVHFPLTGETILVPSYLASLLTSCRDFRALDEHLRSVSGRLGTGDIPPTLHTVFEEAYQSGQFVSEARLREAAEPLPDPSRHRISAVGIVTANRPHAMARCLESFIDHHRRTGRAGRFTIVDDASDPGVRATRRSVLADTARRAAVSIAYAGAEEKRAFVARLAEEGIDSAAAAFALEDVTGSGYSVGANRNALLLNHAGELIFQVDDDIVCRAASPANPSQTLCFTTGHNPYRFEFFPDTSTAMAGATFVDGDVLAEHEAMLGLSVPQCVASSPALAIGEATELSDNLLRLALCGMSRIAVTQNGLRGDSGFGACWPFLLLKGSLRASLHQTERNYRLATSSRIISQTVVAPTISDGAFCMGYALGLDNRTLLPPFFPVRRNEDGVFGAALRTCFTGALFAHVPIQLLHAPPEPRAYAGHCALKPSPLEIGNIVLLLVRSLDFGPVLDGPRRLRMLGRYLIDLSSAAPADFLCFVRERAWMSLQGQIAQIQSLLKTHERRPDYWAVDCDRLVEDLAATAVAPEFGVPADLRNGRTGEEALQLAQRLIARFGELLVAWPDIIEAATVLRTRGVHLAKPL